MSENERKSKTALPIAHAEEALDDRAQTEQRAEKSTQLPERLGHVSEPWHRYLAAVTEYANQWRNS